MFALRQVCIPKRWLRKVRYLSTHKPLVDTHKPLVDLTMDNDGVAVMTLQLPPANVLNLDLLKEMSKALDDVDKNRSKGMILTSGSQNIFSAGLDIKELVYNPDNTRLKEYFWTLQDVWLKLFGSKFITAAAINGHAPAGGCLLAMCCEYRVMTSGKFTIGLNEIALGIAIPTWFIDTMINIIPVREAEYALTTAQLFTVEEALKIGLIDEVAIDKADAIAKCKKFIRKFDNVPPLARSLTKLKMRQTAIKRLHDRREAAADDFLENILHPNTQESIEKYLEMLKKKAL